MASAMNALGRRSDIVLVTHELTDELRHLMREGMIDANIDQNPVGEVRTTVEALAAYFPGKITTDLAGDAYSGPHD